MSAQRVIHPDQGLVRLIVKIFQEHEGKSLMPRDVHALLPEKRAAFITVRRYLHWLEDHHRLVSRGFEPSDYRRSHNGRQDLTRIYSITSPVPAYTKLGLGTGTKTQPSSRLSELMLDVRTEINRLEQENRELRAFKETILASLEKA